MSGFRNKNVLKNIGKYQGIHYIENKNVDHITSYDIPNNITSLGNNCFRDCSNLSSITIPDSIKNIGTNCFNGCENLTSITIPTSVTYLGNKCFNGCCNLKTIYTNYQFDTPHLYGIYVGCNILPYEKSPDLKPIQIKINTPQVVEERKLNLLDYNEYIKERAELIETYQDKSIVKYHESMVDIVDDFNKNVKDKRVELNEYIKVLQNYSENLSEISSNLTKKMDQHTQKLKEIEENNYELPELNTIPKLSQLISIKFIEDTFEDEIILNENYYHKDDLIIPKTNNPYTEIYKLPCKFTEINYENKRILIEAEKKIALLTIEFDYEYIDLSNTDIQYFIETFKNCRNLKEIRYPDSTEYK